MMSADGNKHEAQHNGQTDVYAAIASGPVFFERNRVFRVYTGGKLFHDFFGDEDRDGHKPEEWIASSVMALNREPSDPKEGVSRIENTDIYFDELLNACPEQMLGSRRDMSILVKLLDSAIRLPVQAHPNKTFSRVNFNSEYGKTEAWIILETRNDAHIYFGFNREITKAEFVEVIGRSETDRDAMMEYLTKVPVQRGDVYLIPAGVAHAIGCGCLILEVQEPTDFTIQPEAWCTDYRLSDYEKYIGLSKDAALGCFDFSVYGEKAVRLGRKHPRKTCENDTFASEILIGDEDTDCFTVNRYSLTGGAFILPNAPAVCVVTDGGGQLDCGNKSRRIGKGDYFFLPYSVARACEVRTETRICLIECIPPK